ncbi:1,4-dihydroxy-2-naphthoate polyprenyltransferase [Lacticaseibacillus rhamnosus]|uniref:1,4-dihydroxy-2-naphthoate polyprenyltransferase n=1 Tax=Lacticaseibacillus rhamnosus TaxID=47715 RepID=UPI000532BC14|nr:1,4-dihydroxy-2-naphthoate polyprenyltransferase [Lacticaseibacillus rhamnosus]
MSLPIFLELVEIRTKLASVLPFAIGTLFAVTYFHAFDWLNTLLFFTAMLIFDMMTTALNNLMDYQKAKDAHYQQEVNVIGRARLDPGMVAKLILVMLVVASLLGVVLVVRTDWLLLLMGMACFAIGILYTWGPLPLSRLPLGEIFSGIVMGLGIPVIATYVNIAPGRLLALDFGWPTVVLHGDFIAIVALGLACITPMATIANIMLANNMSDIEEDQRNHRHTLPMYLGQWWSPRVYALLAYAGFLAVILGVIFGALPMWTLVVELAWPLVIRNVHRFIRDPSKQRTFHTAVINLVLENGLLVVGLGMGVVL